MTPANLKPCPFCGGPARIYQDPSHSTAWFCGCEDWDCFGNMMWDETKADAVDKWNRRALPAIHSTIPIDITTARRSLGLTQSQLAPLLGYGDKTRISELERGTREPGAAVVLLLAAYLDGYRPADWPV